MNYRIKSKSRLGARNDLSVLARITVVVILFCIGNSALAEDPMAAPVDESTSVGKSASVEKQIADSQTESEFNVKNTVADNKRLLVTAGGTNLASAPGVNSADWLKAILGLIAVVALIFAIAWFVKRFTGLAVSNQQQMRIISAIPVGAKERIALIEVADKQLLVGITQHNINLLHSFEESVVNKNDKTAVDFSSRLQAILSKGT